MVRHYGGRCCYVDSSISYMYLHCSSWPLPIALIDRFDDLARFEDFGSLWGSKQNKNSQIEVEKDRRRKHFAIWIEIKIFLRFQI